MPFEKFSFPTEVPPSKEEKIDHRSPQEIIPPQDPKEEKERPQEVIFPEGDRVSYSREEWDTESDGRREITKEAENIGNNPDTVTKGAVSDAIQSHETQPFFKTPETFRDIDAQKEKEREIRDALSRIESAEDFEIFELIEKDVYSLPEITETLKDERLFGAKFTDVIDALKKIKKAMYFSTGAFKGGATVSGVSIAVTILLKGIITSKAASEVAATVALAGIVGGASVTVMGLAGMLLFGAGLTVALEKVKEKTKNIFHQKLASLSSGAHS